MCGITGFISRHSNKTPRSRQNAGQAMLATILQRGPDAGDLWQDPDCAVLLGHRRLSILDLSPEGAQPMTSSAGRYVIAFNGEIYNFLSIRRDLENLGIRFRGRSDTEVMLASIEHWGLNQSLQKFNGMFAFALWDRQERTIHFARDRLGKKPLYIGWAGSTLVFGSELKALRAHPDCKPALNSDALTLYMRYACVPAPLTIYKNIASLPPGHRISLKLDALSPGSDLAPDMVPFWDIAETLQQSRLRIFKGDDDLAIQNFETLLAECIKDRMISDVPLGAFLSGGIDSSAVVALMQSQSPRPVKTYTIGFHAAGFDEAGFAKTIAAYLGTDHHELYVSGQDALNMIPQLSSIYDEPFADISAIPTILVSQFARRDVTVALSGDGGDEMLGGYNRHIRGPMLWSKMRLLPAPLRALLCRAITSLPPESWDRLVPFLPKGGIRIHKAAAALQLNNPDALYDHFISRWHNPSDMVKNGHEPLIPLTDTAKHPENLSFAETMMFRDTLSYLPNDILVKVDRASMFASLEARAPLLDRRIYEYVWTLPEHFKIRNGQGKWLLRQVLAKHVPPKLFERPKQGFAMPVAEWLRGSLLDWAENLLDEKSMRADDILNIAEIQKIWNLHKQGKGNNAEKLWSILMFQSWKQKWMP
jgi:asparagine synthase (glutamine-hydrolysing)